MEEYDAVYMQEHCIDVYFIYEGNPFHILTYGTIIPPVLNDLDRNRELQHQVAIDVDREGNKATIHIQQDYVESVIANSKQVSGILANSTQLQPDEETIVQLFKPMAELGFYSYDCIKELDGGRGLYSLVAYPRTDTHPRVYNELPEFSEITVIEREEEQGLVIRFTM